MRGPDISEPHATTYREPEVVTEKRVLSGGAVSVERRRRISHETIAGVHADKRSARQKQLDTTTDVEREDRLAPPSAHRSGGGKIRMQGNGSGASRKLTTPGRSFANGRSPPMRGPTVTPNRLSMRLRLNAGASGKSPG